VTEQAERTPGWKWIIGAVVIVVLILGVLRLIDLIFSLPVLLLAIIGVGGYLWYRSNQKTSV
jgi:hypothetical protein